MCFQLDAAGVHLKNCRQPGPSRPGWPSSGCGLMIWGPLGREARMLRMMDIWRCAIVRQPVESLIPQGIDPEALVWLPDMGPGRFRADPFGIWRDGVFYVFAEAFDYRVRIGH